MTPQSIHRTSGKCQRCCTCCKKGGPAFHIEDRSLIDKGFIHTRHLYTIRKGEMVHDNVRGLVMPGIHEMIKIKGGEESWQCTFYQVEGKASRTRGSAGLDLRACIEGEKILQPGERALLPTGFSIAIPVGFEGLQRRRTLVFSVTAA